jgi:signal transduction histidine kinase
MAEQERIKMTDDIIQRNNNLEQFAYIVSHNLRAPVANISGIIYVMETMKLDKNQENVMVNELSKSIKKLDEVILDLNHILLRKDGNLYQVKEIVYFSELVEDIELSIGNMIVEEQFAIISDFSAINEFMTTKSYLYSIFYNLISNSIKYRRTDIDSFIKIESNMVNNSLVITFEDNGLGIDLQKKGDQVFGLYKRFHYHTEGKGMGLHMVKTQVEALGGKISLESEVDKGTTFVIEFENKLSS